MRVRVVWRWPAVIVALAISACSNDPTEGRGAATSSAAVQEPERLRGAFASADPGGLWVIGGTVVSDDTYRGITEMSVVIDPDLISEAEDGSNDLLVRYGRDGTVVDQVRLPLGSRSLLYGEVVTVDRGAVVAGMTCPGPPLRGCAPSDVRAFAATVSGGEAREIDLGIDWRSPTLSFAGVLNGEAIVVAAEEETGIVATGGHVEALAVDPASSAVRPLPLPEGVRFARSVCVSDDRLFAVTPVLSENLDLAGVEMWAGDGRLGSAMQRIGGVDLPPAYAGGGATACTAGAVALVVITDRARVLMFDTASGSLVTTIDAGVGSVELLADPDQVLLIVRQDEQPPALRLQRWTREGGVSDLSERPDSGRQVLLIGGQVADVTELLEHIPGSDGPAPRDLS